jgi:hypothetical protein
MAMLATVNVSDPSTGLAITCQARFEDEEWQVLLRFEEEAGRLVKTCMIADGCNVNVSLRFNEKTGFTPVADLPPEDDVAAFLHRMRPFVLKDESTSFYRVCGILARRFEDSQLRKMLASQRD